MMFLVRWYFFFPGGRKPEEAHPTGEIRALFPLTEWCYCLSASEGRLDSNTLEWLSSNAPFLLTRVKFGKNWSNIRVFKFEPWIEFSLNLSDVLSLQVNFCFRLLLIHFHNTTFHPRIHRSPSLGPPGGEWVTNPWLGVRVSPG